MWRLGAVALLLAGRGSLAADATSPLPSPAELEARGAIIGKIHIVVGDVFDRLAGGLDDPAAASRAG